MLGPHLRERPLQQPLGLTQVVLIFALGSIIGASTGHRCGGTSAHPLFLTTGVFIQDHTCRTRVDTTSTPTTSPHPPGLPLGLITGGARWLRLLVAPFF